FSFSCQLQGQFHLNEMHKTGDVVLGGLFQVHFSSVSDLSFTSQPQQPTCHGVYVLGFKLAQTMAFAIDEINRNTNLLPNVTLGYTLYDNCLELGIGFRGALSLASGQEDQIVVDDTCVGNPPVVGIVGDSSSTNSIAISNVLGLYRVPMVSYFATCSCLSDRQKYPSFFRTIPSDAFQVNIYTDELRRIVDVMKKSTARVVIVFEIPSRMISLMEEVNQFWEFTFQCRFAPAPAGWLEGGGAICTGQEDLGNVDTEYLDISNLRPEYNVYKAVYALAHSLDDMLRCKPGRGPFSGDSCATLQSLEPWQLVYYMEKVNFTTPSGDQVSFDENGDVVPIYDVINWLWLPDGSTKVQNVGEVKRSAFKGEELILDEGKIFWNFESKQPPRSVCSESCPPGTHMVRRKREPECCFDCIPCSEGKITNKS
ncbi:extracellular calcium-sensing receptor-like, partial [Pundamilia nyererei]|uniref:Extracellular calcium-sensing receptor-like n=1 Tax=Pundamilia nyererei TaxID=303518 RepID=A0A9Y6J5F2_9CICH